MASAKTLVVTGTDTGVGKTVVSEALLRALDARGQRAVGYKPVAAGAEWVEGQLRNDDALMLQRASRPRPAYSLINPYVFESPVAPHLAAESAGATVRLGTLNEAHARLAAMADAVVVEGAGGWLVPLNADISFGGWVAQRGWPVLLVVGMRLGCLNHALLSAEAIGRRCPLVGWVANGLEQPMPALEANIEALRRRLPAPCWGVVPPGMPTADFLEEGPLMQWLRGRDDEDDEA